MPETCLICLADGANDTGYHPRCAKSLFGSTRAPELDLEDSMVQAAGLAMAGRTSLSGVQKKISVKLSTDHRTFLVATEGGRYVLKPQTMTFPSLPEIEHTTMRIAEAVGIETAKNGLLRLKDGNLAYVTKRFDRRDDGSKVRQEDFCQLGLKRPSEKYDGSAELCVRIVKHFTSEPGIELVSLFRQLLFSWWIGNGDLHLKNLSLLVDDGGIIRLTPAYDLVSTRLVIPDDELAMPVCGREQKLMHTTWLKLADYAGIQRKAVIRVIDDQIKAFPESLALVQRSFLSTTLKQTLSELLDTRTEVLSQIHSPN